MKDGNRIPLNEELEAEWVKKALEESLLYGQGKRPPNGLRISQNAFCDLCVNYDNDPIFAACSICRSGKNGRPTGYRRESENGENQLG